MYKTVVQGLWLLVIDLFTSRYPEALADSSFDNTGCKSLARLNCLSL